MGIKNSNDNLSKFIDKDEVFEDVTFSRSQAFIDMRNYFEKNFKKMPVNTPGRFEREDKSIGVSNKWYKDAKVNELFIAYMWGFQYGRVY
jgi:hypothetical protein